MHMHMDAHIQVRVYVCEHMRTYVSLAGCICLYACLLACFIVRVFV